MKPFQKVVQENHQKSYKNEFRIGINGPKIGNNDSLKSPFYYSIKTSPLTPVRIINLFRTTKDIRSDPVRSVKGFEDGPPITRR